MCNCQSKRTIIQHQKLLQNTCTQITECLEQRDNIKVTVRQSSKCIFRGKGTGGLNEKNWWLIIKLSFAIKMWMVLKMKTDTTCLVWVVYEDSRLFTSFVLTRPDMPKLIACLFVCSTFWDSNWKWCYNTQEEADQFLPLKLADVK